MKPEIVYSISNSISQRQLRGFLIKLKSEWQQTTETVSRTLHNSKKEASGLALHIQLKCPNMSDGAKII